MHKKENSCVFKFLIVKYLDNYSLIINFDKVTEIFCLVDEFTTNFHNSTKNFILGNPSKCPPTMSSSENFLPNPLKIYVSHYFMEIQTERINETHQIVIKR